MIVSPKLHWNEDYHSVPNPLKGATRLTSTGAKYMKNHQSDMSVEQRGMNWEGFIPYNQASKEYVQVMSDESSDSSDDSGMEDDVTVLWRVMPDYGELDNTVTNREKDITLHGNKFSGWSNPLSWRDTGVDDDKVLVQSADDENRYFNYIQQRYDESEGPTKVDNGDSDYSVVYREQDTANGRKFSGWTNPLGWRDTGVNDDTVLVQAKYDESEGPTKVDNGDSDYSVVYREQDTANGRKFSGWTNPLGWRDTGVNDDTVLVQQRYDESEGPTKVDNGDSDYSVVYREQDTANGRKFSGWTNPLGWRDTGVNDDTVLLQQRYDESEGPTKVDNGDSDYSVVYREQDTANGRKFSGWTNPLGWRDTGVNDDTVLLQQKYDESEGPTKVDNGDSDYSVVYREQDTANGRKFSGWTNPLGWRDTGVNDDTVL